MLNLTIEDLHALVAIFGFLLGVGLVYLVSLGLQVWQHRRRSKPRAIEALRSDVQERRERLRRAAATEYGRRTDRGQ